MGSITGNEGIIKLDGEKVIQARSWSLDETSDTAENTVIGSESRTYKKSMVSWSGGLDVFYDPDDIAVDDLAPGVQIDLQLYPDGDGPGSLFFVGLAIITSITNAATFDGMTERSISFQGTGQLIRANYIGTFAGNDICDKPGDIPGECTEPDYRNPSERFEERTFEEGDFYTISEITEGVPGHINLVDDDDFEIRPIQVYNAETIAFRTTTAPGPEGWYLIQRDIIAADVVFDDTATIIKGENVQDWNEAADAVIQTALKKTGGTMSGNLILDNNILLSGRNGGNDDNIDIARTNTQNHVAIGGGANSPQTNIQGAGVIGLQLTLAEIQALLPLICSSSITLPNGTGLLARNSINSLNITLAYAAADDTIILGGNLNSPQTIIRAAAINGLQLTAVTIESLLEHWFSAPLILRNNIPLQLLDAAGTARNIIRLDTNNDLALGVSAPIPGGSDLYIFQNGVIAEQITDTYHDHIRTPTNNRQNQENMVGAVNINFTLGAVHNITCSGAVQLSFIAPTGNNRAFNGIITIFPNGHLVTIQSGIFWPGGIVPVIDSGRWLMSVFWHGTAWHVKAEEYISV